MLPSPSRATILHDITSRQWLAAGRRLGIAPRVRAAPGRLVAQCPAAPVAPDRAHPTRLLRPDAATPAQDTGARAEPRRHRERRVGRCTARTNGTACWSRHSGGIAAFALFFGVNLMNPRWMAFGDVRLSLVFGFGLAWVSPMALCPGLPLRQHSGSRRRRRSDRPPPSGSQISPALRPLHGTRCRAGPAPLELGRKRAGCRRGRSQNLDVVRLVALSTGSDGELHGRSRFDAVAGVSLDLRMVDEEVFAATVLDEPVAT